MCHIALTKFYTMDNTGGKTMNNSHLNVRKIINISKYQKLQDDISLSTGLAIILVDHTGIPLTTHSNCTEFCRLMRTMDETRNLCEKCDARGGLEAVRIHNTFIYACHAGIVDMAIPIIVDGLYLGAFMAGQVRLDQQKDFEQLEHIMYNFTSKRNLSYEWELNGLYESLPVMSLEKIKSIAHMLYYFADLCVERSLYRITMAEQPQENLSLRLPSYSPLHEENNDNSTIELLKYKSVNSNRLIQPSLNYIRNHLDEKITLAKMASLCHISPSYYSKIFSREGLGSLSNYVNHLKIEKAKELLTRTDISVGAVAANLGYDESSYFIKIFKIETGITPARFRMDLNNDMVSVS